MRYRAEALILFSVICFASIALTACANITTNVVLPYLAPSEKISCRFTEKAAFSFVDLDTGYARQVFGVSAPEYLNRQIDSIMKLESPASFCSKEIMGTDGIALSIDSITYEKQDPHSALPSSSGGGIKFTYQSDYKIRAIASFSILKGSEKHTGKIEYSKKIFAVDFDEVLAANRFLIKKIGLFLNGNQ